MSDTVIQVENLGKKYIIGHQQEGTGGQKTLRDAMANGAEAIRSRLLKPAKGKMSNPTVEEFWALKDVSFEIKQGDRVGIIGRNGAGKSTLLKILSRITEPTTGRISIEGRVASLLEVGTGFHAELTGRENIYLNGAILGMSKAEIKKKFDEIVDFAEVEKFLDTPVKRYSSGMYVRLAFAVAAHLEPEILIVDEVLAVGDVAFQQKCLGKMEDVSTKEGRTVLFVSHNMQAVSRLTNRCIWLAAGQCKFDGATDQTVNAYNKVLINNLDKLAYYQASSDSSHNHLTWAKVDTSEGEGIHRWGQSINFEFGLCITEPGESLCFSFQVMNDLQEPICHFWFLNPETQQDHLLGRLSEGIFVLRCKIDKFRLYMGSYTLTTWLGDRRLNTLVEKLSDICPFEVTMEGIHREVYEWSPKACAYIEEAVWEPVNRVRGDKKC